VLELAWPWLLASMPAPLLAGWLLPRARVATGAALRLPYRFIEISEDEQASGAPASRRIFALLAWALLVLAAARPQWIGEPQDMPQSGRDLLLAIDTSGSMSIDDMQLAGATVPRFTATQAIASDFIARRKGDRVGMILFGSRAYLLVPLTFDRRTVAEQLRGSAIGLAGRETAIGDAVGLAVKRLRDRPESQRVLVLLTDGVNTAGELDPDKAAEIAATNHVRVYTIGIGADRMRVGGLFGSRVVNPSVDLDEAMLTRLATQTGGRYFRARDSEELARIYAELDRLEPIDDARQTLRPIDELFWLPLAAAMFAMALALFAPAGWRLRREGSA